MRQSELFTKTRRQAPSGETSINARLLEQGGFITKLMAGVYCYLPLGLRVLRKIENIIRQEMDALGAQEVFLPALQPKELWEKTGRWSGLKDVMYQFTNHSDRAVGLAITHEEVIAEIIRQHVTSYKDLPFALYQIQTKFRHELRAKSGLIRGREFSMKDLYSCHTTSEDCKRYYELVKNTYCKIFTRLGLKTLIVEASGGDFSKDFSHEFQVLSDAGEDHILYCEKGDYARNREITEEQPGQTCPSCSSGKLLEGRAIEVGNIFQLGTRFSEGIGAHFADEKGKQQPIVMASYGIGPSRVMGTIVELHHDAKGIIWPTSVSPFAVHLIVLGKDEESAQQAEELYQSLLREGVEVLYDDRSSTAGEKFNDADLIGIPHRVVISKRTKGKVEYLRRGTSEPAHLLVEELKKILSKD